jgi:hypothetical protein
MASTSDPQPALAAESVEPQAGATTETKAET